MMKKWIMAGIAMMTVAISSCDEDTTTMGNSLTDVIDQFTIVTDTFNVSTRSIIADSVLSRSSYSYIGRIKDPETGAYITSDFMTQFTILENELGITFAPKDSILGRDANNEPQADSCFINIIINSYQGDSLTAMKLTALELEKPVEENKLYYSNFDPEAAGYVRTGGISQSKVYTMSDLTLSDSLRNVRRNNDYYEYISIPLNKPYTDKEGNTYNNFGTYLMRTYYNHPEYFKNSITFTKNVFPGIYLKTTDGLGLMAEVLNSQLVTYYHFKDNGVYIGSKTFYGTEEVLQTTHITNDKSHIQQLAEEDTCTYLKTPAGIFTEVTLPVDDIKRGHENDTITSAKIVFRRMNDASELSDVVLEEPQNLLMIERDSLYSFFENANMYDNITSYLATYSSTYNTYTYYNISSLINHMYQNRNSGSPNWNKVVLIPVQTTTTSSASSSSYYYSNTTTSVTGVSNEMSITSVRLVGGSNNRHEPVTISVIYNQNK